VARRRLGLQAKLLALLMAFGLVPLVVVVVTGYAVARATIIRQASASLLALASAQATHVDIELSRQRLLLRTIAGQLTAVPRDRLRHPGALADLLVQSLPERGVFDGLRIVTPGGLVRTQVALRNAAPHWPPETPATDWDSVPVAVHREGNRTLAYLVAVPLELGWLEGHVRREDFSRIFSLPEHIVPRVESALFDTAGWPIVGMHAHATLDIGRVISHAMGHLEDSVRIVDIGRSRVLLAMAAVPGTSWRLASAMPIELALAPLTRLRWSAVGGALVLLGLIVTAGVVSARSVTTPLRDLAARVRTFGRDGHTEPLRHRTADEVGDVIEAFNEMAAERARSGALIEELHGRDMERAQQLASVGELASGVAHEIRNPLTGVQGALELALQRLPAAEPSRPLLEEAQQQLARIDSATTQLLRFARPPELRQVVVDPNLLIERAVNVVGAQAARSDVRLRSEPCPDPVQVCVDPELMVQVLVNLMLNGIEAMVPSGVLTIWGARHAPHVWIGVADTGPGVPTSLRAEIFRPFVTTKHHGTGLGLSISQQIVQRHGGTLRVEDTPGGGATFVVAIPFAHPEDPAA